MKDKILIVDDDPDSLEEMTEAVRRFGKETVAASGVAEAIARLREDHAINIVLTDLYMPDSTGFDLPRLLRAMDRPMPALVLVTGRSSYETAVQALRSEFVDLVEKPVSSAALRAALERAGAAQERARLTVDDAATVLQGLDRARALLQRLAPGPGSAVPSGRTADRIAPDSATIPADTARKDRGNRGDDIDIRRAIQQMIKLRTHLRSTIGEDLTADPCLDIYLHVADAELAGKVISVSSACFASGVPTTTALRRLKDLEHAGLVWRDSHPNDRRLTLLRLSEKGRSKLDAVASGIAGGGVQHAAALAEQSMGV